MMLLETLRRQMTERTYCWLAALFTLLLISGVSAVPAYADQNIALPLGMPIQVKASASFLGCTNSPGPTIEFGGDVILGGFNAQLIFQNNLKGTHSREADAFTFNFQLTTGGTLSIPKQPVLGGVGGNPHIWIQFYGPNGPVSDPIYLGRCVQGGGPIDASLLSGVLAALTVSGVDCSNNPGPYITVGPGSLTFAGLGAKFILSNQDDPKGTRTTVVPSGDPIGITLITNGLAQTFPKQPPQGGVGGNPHILLQLLQGNGTPIGEPIYLGRCVQL